MNNTSISFQDYLPATPIDSTCVDWCQSQVDHALGTIYFQSYGMLVLGVGFLVSSILLKSPYHKETAIMLGIGCIIGHAMIQIFAGYY